MRLITATLLIWTGLVGSGCSRTPDASADPASADSARTLRFFDILNIDVRDIPMLMALDDLAAQGYTVQKTYMSSTALIADALARDDADIGLGNNLMMWTAITKGAPIRTIAQFTSSTTVLAATADIQSCAELDGKRMGLASTRGLSPALLNTYFQSHCPGTAPKYFVIVESAGRAAALLAGEIDAEVVPGEELVKIQLEKPDKFHAIMSYASEFPEIRVDGLHVRQKWVEENPAGVRDFLRALLRAQRRVAENPRLLYEEAAERLDLAPDVAEAVGRVHLENGIWDPNGGLTDANVQGTIDYLTGIGSLPQGLRSGDVTDLSYLNEVLDEIGRK